MMKGRRGNAFFWIPFIIMYIIFSVVVIVQLNKNISGIDSKIGYSSILVLNTIERGDVADFYIQQSAKRALQDTLYTLSDKGGTLAGSCGEYDGYTLWNSETKDCFPSEDGLKEAISNDFKTKMDWYLGLYPVENIPNLEFDYIVNSDGGTYKILGTAKKRLRLDISKDDKPNFEETLFSIDVAGGGGGSLSNDDCYYCEDMKPKLQEFDPQAAASCTGRCCKGKCPTGSKILDVPYYNQCSFTPRQPYCGNACGVTSLKMALESGGFDAQSISFLWDNGGCSAGGGCDMGVFYYVYSCLIGACKLPIYIKPSYEQIKTEIDAGHPMIVHNKMSDYCSEACYCGGGHFHLLVGYSDDYVILNDPYTLTAECTNLEIGHNLVLSKQTFSKVLSYTGFVAPVKRKVE
jgi:uncharacterized protein YvpB